MIVPIHVTRKNLHLHCLWMVADYATMQKGSLAIDDVYFVSGTMAKNPDAMAGLLFVKADDVPVNIFRIK